MIMKLSGLVPLALLALTASALPAALLHPMQSGQPVHPVQEERPKLDPARVEDTVEALEKAFEDGDVEARINALNKALDVPHEDVVELVAVALGDRDPTVVDTALETLRFLEHDAALDALHKTLARDKRFKADQELTPKLLRAIGQHGNPKSISVLTKDLFRGSLEKQREITGARILALGQIRSKQSVEALVSLMNKASHKNVYPHMDELRLSLMVLTGADHGKDREQWQLWWNENKKELVVGEELPLLPERDKRRWDRYWGNAQEYERRTKRGERGKG